MRAIALRTQAGAPSGWTFSSDAFVRWAAAESTAFSVAVSVCEGSATESTPVSENANPATPIGV